ncbi:uncharacterized protein PGTG_12919 [Puccinia graminis f. sp. tritici CRL 75-36-700-3]|uniref:Uncharacterized protein n=1 Tax=Puccinia graminis f. sp. tritici (strain CRL 75-36-700-3 / race SCCL) TaxID=418459 RepID=E3KSP9_PUCGT|nr:uncharacterized protein PGTG_12919 [Puccinia graminis f. sp. tritici CRL 75-36-700-3]EFP87335.1 hypothetical protein PGTG_12919 [Puccinia graminis f. sp. tritici CRL 75-36-700-3]
MQTQSWETGNAIQKLMQSNNHPAAPFLSWDWRIQANEKSRTSVDWCLGLLDSKQLLGGFQDLERIHTTLPQKLSLGVRSDNPLGSASQTEGVSTPKKTNGFEGSTPKPLEGRKKGYLEVLGLSADGPQDVLDVWESILHFLGVD